MSKSDNDLRYQLINLVESGADARRVADALDISITRATKLVKEYLELKEGNRLDLFLDVDAAVLKEALAEVADQSPMVIQGEVLAATKNIAKAKDATDALREDLIVTANNLNTRIRSFAISAKGVDELSVLVKSLCDLQSAFFNRPTTAVQINNNLNGEGQTRFGSFLSDKPAD